MTVSLEDSRQPALVQDPSTTGTPNYVPTLPEIGRKIGRNVWSLWSVATIVVMLVAVGLAYQSRPTLDIDLGGGFDAPYLNLSEGGFGNPVQLVDTATTATDTTDDGESSGREAITTTTTTQTTVPEALNQDYRWTRERPILLLPGIGSWPGKLTLVAAGSPLIPAGQQVDMLLNGIPFTQFTLKPGVVSTQEWSFTADQTKNGSLAIEMRVKSLGPVNADLIQQYPGTYIKIDQNLYQGQTGFKLYSAALQPQPGGLIIPPLGVTLALVVSAWLLYISLAYAGLKGRYAFGVVAMLSLLAGLGLVVVRLGLTTYTSRLALLLVVTTLFLPILDWVTPRIYRSWRMALPKWAAQGLLILFLIGMLGRGGGVLYPQTEIIDAPAHLKEINTVLHDPDGFSKELHSKDLSKVPSQWGSNAIIPYSPFVYFYLAPVAALPVDPYISVNLFNALLDALRVFIIFGLAMALGTGTRAAFTASALYLIIPCTWMLNSWGNWPTTVSFWLATLYLLLVLAYWQRLNRPVIWLSSTFVLLLTMLAYTVTAVFIGMLLLGWAVGLIFFVKKDPVARRNGLLMGGATLTAAALAVVLYYDQFIPDLANTLTSFSSSLENKGSLGGFGDRTLPYYLGLYADHVTFRYGATVVILAATAVWLWAIFAKRGTSTVSNFEDLTSLEPNETRLRSGSFLWLAGAWFAVFWLFGLAQWKVDMVDKQVWFVLPLAVCLAGVVLNWAWQTFKTPTGLLIGRAFVTGLVLWTTYSAATLWLDRVFIKRR